MISWKKRPFEIANLLNPGFCTFLLFEAMQRYQRRSHHGMPYALFVLIIPIVLHKSTRDALPRRPNALLHPWLEKNANVRIGFARRVKALLPFTKEAIIFGLRAKVFIVNESGEIVLGPNSPRQPNWESDTEVADCQRAAGLLGSWLSQVQDITSLYIMWGIQP
jgi:hypothetical protein